MVKIKRLKSFEDIGKKTWNGILDRSPENYIFQTYDFTSTWWKYFGKNRKGMELLLLLVEDSASPVAIAPLMIKTLPWINKPIIQFVGTDICDYMNFLIDNRNYGIYISKIMQYLSTLRFLEVDLRFVPGDSGALERIGGIDKKSGMLGKMCRIDSCPYINLQNEWQKIISGIRKKLRGEIRKNERKIKEAGNLTFGTYNQEMRLEKALKDYFELHVKKWKYYAGRYSQFQYKHWRDFVTELSWSIKDKGWLDISYLELNGDMITCHFGFTYNGRLYYYMPTFDPALAAYSPAKILIMKMLKRSYNNRLKEFDFLRGAEPYKLAWTKTFRSLYRISWYNKNTYLRYLGFIYRSLSNGYAKNVKPVLKKAKPLMRQWYKSKGDEA